MNEIYLTLEQLEKTKEELNHYIHIKRPEVVERIKEAKSYGDLSENSEYDSAREEQAFVEAKIKELEVIAANCKIIETVENSDVVVLGTTAVFLDLDLDKEFTYKIVGVGADPLDGNPSISTATPVARALLGMEVNQEKQFEVPSGTKKIRLLEIR